MVVPAASATAPSPLVLCAEAVLGVNAAPCFQEGKHPSLALLCCGDLKLQRGRDVSVVQMEEGSCRGC